MSCPKCCPISIPFPVPLSHCGSTREMQGLYFKPATELAPRFQNPFRDDFGATAKAFQKLNSFRSYYGFKHVQWNDILGELAVQRAHEFTRSKKPKMPFTTRGSKFNIGVPFVDIVVYIAIEHENGKLVPIEKSLRKAWSAHERCTQYFLEPLSNFAAVSVIKNDLTICFSILISRLPPFYFSPMIRSRPMEKEEPRHRKKWDSIMQEISLLSNSLQVLKKDEEKAEGRKIDEKDNDDVEAFIDEYEDHKTDEEFLEEYSKEPKSETTSFVPVVHEVPLMKPPQGVLWELPCLILDPTDEAIVEAMFDTHSPAATTNPAK